MKEQTLVLIKPDGVQRGLIGNIIQRFEQAGLKILAMKMHHADPILAKKHYPLNEKWAKQAYEKTLKVYKEQNKTMHYKNHLEMGKALQSQLAVFLQESPVIALILEGPHAIQLTRKIVGSTEPRQAAPGTIRGDLASIESYSVADEKKRAVRNLIHASDSLETAKKEISAWFMNEEIHSYQNELDKHL
jgi:nucleoside-diphosphate kinase